MSCSHPQFGYTDGAGFHYCGDLRSVSAEYLEDFRERVKRVYGRFYVIPCGKCLSCRMSYARDWAFRCKCEFDSHDRVGSFVTLTYNPDHLPVLDGHPTLFKPDYQKFLKRFRKAYPDVDFSYLGCGEYGGKTMRPHYHFLFFGFVFDDIYPFFRSPVSGCVTYRSPTLERLWSLEGRSLGISSVGVVNERTIDYVTRYSVKKCTQDTSMCPVQPFLCASRRPAIGLRWFETNYPDLAKFSALDTLVESCVIYRGRKHPVPRYFRKKLLPCLDESRQIGYTMGIRDMMREVSFGELLDLRSARYDSVRESQFSRLTFDSNI